jgi:uncharacterized membrane protein YccC
MTSLLSRISNFFSIEYKNLTQINKSDRPWQMPFAASIAMGLPLLIGVQFDHLNYGLPGCLGGMVFLYLPNTPMHHRIITLLSCAFGMLTCYSLGVISQFTPNLMVLCLGIIATVITIACRFFMLPPPGSLFFIMATSIGMFIPMDVLQVPFFIGLMGMGSILALGVALLYSLYILKLRPAGPIAAVQAPSFDFVIIDSVMNGLTVELSLFVALSLHLPRPYWVPISCLSVIQGLSTRAGWNTLFQRVLGSSAGLVLAWFILNLHLDNWSICFVMMALNFLIETLAVRNFGLAMIFLTPLTIYIAEASRMGSNEQPLMIIQSRVTDTVLGSLIGVVCGWILSQPKFRSMISTQMRKLIPSKPSY